MSNQPENTVPSTPDATAATAQSHTPESVMPTAPIPESDCAGESVDFLIGSTVTRAVHGRPCERKSNDPVYRPLKIFTLDPAESRLEGSVSTINIPYEPLQPGPVGSVFRVDNNDGWQRLRRVDLDDPKILIQNGLDPSPTNPQFHQQMVYAVCSSVYAAFRTAVGRHIAWGFETKSSGDSDSDPDSLKLLIRPWIPREKNAYYDKEHGQLCFGYYRADQEVAGRNLPEGLVFTCLSHDIIAHELTHALLDGLRTHFTIPSNPDVLAFHEGFADLVAIFQHFSYEQVVEAAIRKSRGNLAQARMLTDLARQFGHTTGSAQALRSAIDITDEQATPKPYGQDKEPHTLGSVLVSAVFEAFMTIYKRKTERYIRLATGGSGVIPPGELSADLKAVLAEEASKLASQFLTMCIRAIDYCPPVDLEFGEYLRAVITADYNLVPSDPWGYREAWIDAFRRRQIYPTGVDTLSEDALLWRPPSKPTASIDGLTFANLRFAGDPGRPADAKELRRQACTLGQFISRPEYLEAFGLAHPDDPRLGGDKVELPCVQSIRSARRVGPSGQILFDLIAEVTQRRLVLKGNRQQAFDFYGGATIIIGPEGEIRYVVYKNTASKDRLTRQQEFVSGDTRARLWERVNGKRVPQEQLFRLLHHQVDNP
jgi:hypothetical protein